MRTPREVRGIQRDKQTAEHVALAEYNKIKSKSAQFSFKLAYANPQLIPEAPLMFLGFKPLIDEIIWLGNKSSAPTGCQWRLYHFL